MSDAATDLMRTRIRDRLQELDLPATTAAVQAGLDRSFLSDFLAGKKHNIASSKILPLAHVLQISVGAMLGEDASCKAVGNSPDEAHRVQCSTIFEASAWREPSTEPVPLKQAVNLTPDPRWPASSQSAGIIFDAHADEILPSGSIAHLVAWSAQHGHLHGGTLVGLRQRKPDGTVQATIRRVTVKGDTLEFWLPSASMVAGAIEAPVGTPGPWKIGNMETWIGSLVIGAYVATY